MGAQVESPQPHKLSDEPNMPWGRRVAEDFYATPKESLKIQNRKAASPETIIPGPHGELSTARR